MHGFDTFDNNWGFWGGAIYNVFGAIMSDFEDFTFENLRGEVGVGASFGFHW